MCKHEEKVFLCIAKVTSSLSIHPRYKRQIGYRLALGGLNLAYGLGETTGRFQGPFPTAITQQGGQILIEFDSGQADLEFRAATGFEVGALFRILMLFKALHAASRMLCLCSIEMLYSDVN